MQRTQGYTMKITPIKLELDKPLLELGTGK